MLYQTLYTLTIVVFALVIAWCFFKIRKLMIENVKLKMKLSCRNNDIEILRFDLKRCRRFTNPGKTNLRKTKI